MLRRPPTMTYLVECGEKAPSGACAPAEAPHHHPAAAALLLTQGGPKE